MSYLVSLVWVFLKFYNATIFVVQLHLVRAVRMLNISHDSLELYENKYVFYEWIWLLWIRSIYNLFDDLP